MGARIHDSLDWWPFFDVLAADDARQLRERLARRRRLIVALVIVAMFLAAVVAAAGVAS